jgi:hypothetical protein
MHDLDVHYDDGHRGAVEVVTAADGECIALWNLVNGGGRRVIEGIDGGWSLWLTPGTRVNQLNRVLPTLLSNLESLGLRQVPRHGPRHALVDAAHAVGIAHGEQYATDYPGSVYFSIDLPIERSAGFVAHNGDALSEWVSEFLAAESQRDVLHKLSESHAEERHAFVILPGFPTAPFAVTDVLMRREAPLPTQDPVLPRELSHIWVVSSWSSGVGFRWAPGRGWSTFDKSVGDIATAS